MIHGLAQMLRTAACPQVHSMNAVAVLKRRLRKAVDVSGVCRTFQPMDTDDLAFRRRNWPMLINENAVFLIDSILLASRRKALLVYVPRPEIAGNGEKVRIAKEWYELALQTPIVSGSACRFAKIALPA